MKTIEEIQRNPATLSRVLIGLNEVAPHNILYGCLDGNIFMQKYDVTRNRIDTEIICGWNLRIEKLEDQKMFTRFKLEKLIIGEK